MGRPVKGAKARGVFKDASEEAAKRVVELMRSKDEKIAAPMAKLIIEHTVGKPPSQKQIVSKEEKRLTGISLPSIDELFKTHGDNPEEDALVDSFQVSEEYEDDEEYEEEDDGLEDGLNEGMDA